MVAPGYSRPSWGGGGRRTAQGPAATFSARPENNNNNNNTVRHPAELANISIMIFTLHYYGIILVWTS